jgi:hypothetical protein
MGETDHSVSTGTSVYVCRRSPIWIARCAGAGSCVFAVALIGLGLLTERESRPTLVFFGLIALAALVFGTFFLWQARIMTRLRAEVSPHGLRITAHAGRHLWLQRGIASAEIPWAEVQGFSAMRTLNTAMKENVQATWFLYTARGDFTLNDVQWADLDGLVREIESYTGREPDDVAPARASTQAEMKSGQRRLFSVQRFFGWTIVIVCAPCVRRSRCWW